MPASSNSSGPAAESRPRYLVENDDFYRNFWTTTANYSGRFPNAEEAERAGVILTFLGELAERHRWAGKVRLLDVGCGRGWLTNLLALYGQAEGCEPVEAAIAIARTLFPHITFHATTPGELCRSAQFRPFDLVVSSEVLEHIPSADQSTFMAELHACVSLGGHVVLTTPRGELKHTRAGTSSQQPLENWLTEAEVETLLQSARFRPIALRRASPIRTGAIHRWHTRIRRWMKQPHESPTAIGAFVDHRTALYQVWCAQRLP